MVKRLVFQRQNYTEKQQHFDVFGFFSTRISFIYIIKKDFF